MFDENLNFENRNLYEEEHADLHGIEEVKTNNALFIEPINPNYQFYFPDIDNQLEFAYDLDFVMPDDPVPLFYDRSGQHQKKYKTICFQQRPKSVSKPSKNPNKPEFRQSHISSKLPENSNKVWNSTVKTGLFDNNLKGNELGVERRTIRQQKEREEKMKTYDVKFGLNKKKLGVYTKIDDMAQGLYLTRF